MQRIIAGVFSTFKITSSQTVKRGNNKLDQVHFDARLSRLVGQIHFPEGRQPVETVLHCPLPAGMQLTKTSAGKLLPDKSGVVFTNGRGIMDFEMTVRTTVK